MFWYLVLAIVLVRLVAIILQKVKWSLSEGNRLKVVNGLFVNNYLDAKVLFVARCACVPSIGVITQIDATQAYAFIKEKLDSEVVHVHQVNVYDHDEGSTFFNVTILELNSNRMVEIGNGYVEVLYTQQHYEWAMSLLKELAICRVEIQEAVDKTPTVIGFARAMEMN